MTSFYLNPLFNNSVSQHSPILRSWGLALQLMNLGDTILL